MHQAHTIPWNMLASHFVFIRDNPHRTPRTTDIFPIEPPRPTRAGDLMHFTRVLATTIRSFARTEREKHPSAEELRLQVTPTPTSDSNTNSTNILSMNTKETSIDPSSSSSSTITPPKLFPGFLLTRYPKYLTTKMQNPVYWDKRARRSVFDGRPIYSTSDGDLADAIKVLMYATDARAVLCLAHLPFEKGTQNAPGQNPHVPFAPGPALRALSNLSWGHSFGFNRIVDSALWAYIYLNLSASLDLVSSGTFMETHNFAVMFRDTTQEMDYCAQQLPHRDFWGRMGINSTDPCLRLNPEFCSRFDMYVPKSRPWTGSDLEWMERYLKEVFRLLYVYDMVMRECGMEVRWEDEIVFTVRGITRAAARIDVGVVEFR